MQNLQNLFTSNQWELISDILQNGKSQSWLSLARKYGIRPEGNSEQRRKAANDVYRKYLKKSTTVTVQPKILIYDIETARVTANLWWSGKQYVNGSQITNNPGVITIAWKWLGADKVECLKWDKKQSDKKLIKAFLKEYNKADMVVGYNNDNFDNRWINARALKYNFEVNTFVKSFDIMKQSKRLFRLPAYSMNFLAKYTGVATKLQHSGLSMWEDIQYGTKKEAKKAMKMMIEYNIQDIIVTEQVYLRVRKYMKTPIHYGVLQGKKKNTCPTCGSSKIEKIKTTTTTAGTIQHIMRCKKSGTQFKLSNSQFLKL